MRVRGGLLRGVGRALFALAIAFPIFVVLSATAAQGSTGANGTTVLRCSQWNGIMNISPGVTNDPAHQSVAAHGRLHSCNKAGSAAQYSATLQMTQATCSDVAMRGVATFDWANGAHSTASLNFQPRPLGSNKLHVHGRVTSGAFDGTSVRAWLMYTRVFEGSGARCSPTNPLKKITFTNCQSSFELWRPPSTTTTSVVASTTSVPRSTSSAPNTTVPQTTATTVPITVPITGLGTTTPTTSPAPGGPGDTRPRSGGGGGPVSDAGSPGGTLALTGGGGFAALFGFEALLVGAALACFAPDRRQLRLSRLAYQRHGAKSWLRVTLPPTF